MIYNKRMQTSATFSSSLLYQLNEEPRNRIEVMKMFNAYEGAMKSVSAMLETLDAEFRTVYDHNPIHHMESRIKSFDSILEKLGRKGLEPTIGNINRHITDVVGLRIVCHYVDDIYRLTDLLCSQGSIQVIRKTDYINSPKQNGYRSMHLVVRVPVALSDRTEMVAVEIQLRTIAMDMWASLEHELHYKTSKRPVEHLEERLRRCAVSLADIDLRMQEIFDRIQEGDEYEEEEAQEQDGA